MPVDKFGRMSDTKTKDTGVSLTYINNNYIRSDGGTPVSGSIDMRGNTLYNVSNLFVHLFDRVRSVVNNILNNFF